MIEGKAALFAELAGLSGQRAAQPAKADRAADHRHPQRDRVIEHDRGGGRRGGEPVEEQRAQQAAFQHANAAGDRN